MGGDAESTKATETAENERESPQLKLRDTLGEIETLERLEH